MDRCNEGGKLFLEPSCRYFSVNRFMIDEVPFIIERCFFRPKPHFVKKTFSLLCERAGSIKEDRTLRPFFLDGLCLCGCLELMHHECKTPGGRVGFDIGKTDPSLVKNGFQLCLESSIAPGKHSAGISSVPISRRNGSRAADTAFSEGMTAVEGVVVAFGRRGNPNFSRISV